MSFLPIDYKVPSTSNYLNKFADGKNKIRILSDAVMGFEYWNTEKKPIRSKEMPEEIPQDIQLDKDGKFKINHFWAFQIWNYNEDRAQILMLTKKSIMDAIKTYVDEPDWGDPKKYDLVIIKTGSGFDIEYETIANPHSPIPEKAKNAPKVNLEALISGDDPFKV